MPQMAGSPRPARLVGVHVHQGGLRARHEPAGEVVVAPEGGDDRVDGASHGLGAQGGQAADARVFGRRLKTRAPRCCGSRRHSRPGPMRRALAEGAGVSVSSSATGPAREGALLEGRQVSAALDGHEAVVDGHGSKSEFSSVDLPVARSPTRSSCRRSLGLRELSSLAQEESAALRRPRNVVEIPGSTYLAAYVTEVFERACTARDEVLQVRVHLRLGRLRRVLEVLTRTLADTGTLSSATAASISLISATCGSRGRRRGLRPPLSAGSRLRRQRDRRSAVVVEHVPLFRLCSGACLSAGLSMSAFGPRVEPAVSVVQSLHDGHRDGRCGCRWPRGADHGRRARAVSTSSMHPRGTLCSPRPAAGATGIVLVNGHHAGAQRVLEAGDQVSLFPPLGGG